MGGAGSRSAVNAVEALGAAMRKPGIAFRNRHGGCEKGFAVVIVLLALLILAGIATTAVAAALGQLRAAGMAGRVIADRAAARGGMERVLAEIRGRSPVAVGGSAVALMADTVGAMGSWRVLDLRIAREFHVFVAEANPGDAVRIRAARVVWWMEPESRVAAYRAVVESDSVVVGTGARVDADSLLAGRRGLPACDSLPLLAGALGGSLVPPVGRLPQPPEWGAGRDGADFADMRLGWFGRSMLVAAADHNVVGGGVPKPGCTGCWAGLVFGSGDVQLTGSGAGVLAVDGNLVFASGSSWIGLVLASGSVTFEPGSTLLGLIRGGESVTLIGNSVVDGSACAALGALRAATALTRPIPAPTRSWLGPLPPGTE